MEGIGVRLLKRVARAAVPAAGVLALGVLQLHHARLAGATPLRARALLFSDEARRLLLLQYQSYPTEFLGCMIGAVSGDTVIVQRIAPADVDPGESTATSVVPRQTCEDAGWANTVGMVHSQQWHLLQLRVLGAWWCLGSSALEPYLLLRYSRGPGQPTRCWGAG